MEINEIFIDEDILDLIFQKLSFEHKINFSQLSNFTYIKYKDSIKYTVYKCINNDYHIFKRCFQRYKYSEEEINSLGIDSVRGIRTIWCHPIVCGHYDLRYIFELIYNGLDINNKDIIDNTNALNLHYIIKKIKQCVSFSRFETIQNINNEPVLRSLHMLFKPIGKKNKVISKWEYI